MNKDDLTFGSACVDSGTQPDQLVSFLRGKVLDPHQRPVWLTHTKNVLLQKDFSASLSPTSVQRISHPSHSPPAHPQRQKEMWISMRVRV